MGEKVSYGCDLVPPSGHRPLPLMLLLAASALSRVKEIPPEVWKYVAITVVAIIALVLIVRKLAGTNKIWLTIIAGVVISIVGFQCVYERNEPKFLTPIVDKIAPFFPSKIDYNATQKKDVKM